VPVDSELARRAHCDAPIIAPFAESSPCGGLSSAFARQEEQRGAPNRSKYCADNGIPSGAEASEAIHVSVARELTGSSGTDILSGGGCGIPLMIGDRHQRSWHEQ
jgi:hypothetical protein